MSETTLAELAAAVPGARVVGDPTTRVRDVFHDSRRAAKGTLFAVRRGEKSDGRAFVAQALASGAVALLVDDETVARGVSAPAIVVSDVRAALGRVASRTYGEPFGKLSTVGITETIQPADASFEQWQEGELEGLQNALNAGALSGGASSTSTSAP